MTISTNVSINLSKGEALNLSKTAPGLQLVSLGLGWSASPQAGLTFDLDASAFMLNEQGKVVPPENFIFFNNLKSRCGSVVHLGDNLTGDGDGDDETINVDLSKVPADIHSIHFAITIFDAAKKNQRFGQVKNAYVRIYNTTTKDELGKADLTEDSSGAAGIVAASLYRHNNEWKFKPLGDPILNLAGQPTGNLAELLTKYGLQGK